MADLTQDVIAELVEERVAVADNLKDNTTLLMKRIPGIRNTAAATNLQDTNQALDNVLPGVLLGLFIAHGGDIRLRRLLGEFGMAGEVVQLRPQCGEIRGEAVRFGRFRLERLVFRAHLLFSVLGRRFPRRDQGIDWDHLAALDVDDAFRLWLRGGGWFGEDFRFSHATP